MLIIFAMYLKQNATLWMALENKEVHMYRNTNILYVLFLKFIGTLSEFCTPFVHGLELGV
jgi:hypothetical protein